MNKTEEEKMIKVTNIEYDLQESVQYAAKMMREQPKGGVFSKLDELWDRKFAMLLTQTIEESED